MDIVNVTGGCINCDRIITKDIESLVFKTLTSGGKDQLYTHAHSWKGKEEVPNAIWELLSAIRVQSLEFG